MNPQPLEKPASLGWSWLTIWISPRQTIRRIVDTNAEYGVIPLAVLSGIQQVLDRASKQGWGDNQSLIVVLIFALVGGVLSGIVGVYLNGALYQWTGSWLGGQATTKEVRCAAAWSSIADIALLIFVLPLIGVFGRNWFTSSADWLSPTQAGVLLAFLGTIGLVSFCWKVFLFAKCLAEVHRFSAWKGLATAVLGMAVIVVPVVAFLLLQRALAG